MELENVQISAYPGALHGKLSLPPTGGVRGWDTFYAASTVDLPAPSVATTQVVTYGEPSAESRRQQVRGLFEILAREPRRIPSTDARRDLAALLEWSVDSGRPAVITNHGRPQAVLLSFAVFQRILKTFARDLLAGRASRTHFAHRVAEDVIDAEMSRINERLRRRADA